MINIEDFYCLGEPIETKLGDCHFILVKEQPYFLRHLDALSLTKEKIIFLRSQQGESKEIIEELQKLTLVDLVLIHSDIKDYYVELFAKVFRDETAFFRLENAEEFMAYRQLIIKMNVVKEEKINPNPEIQKWIEKSKKFKDSDGSKITINDMISSIAMGSGYLYKQIGEMTIYQMHMSFNRINSFKNYDTSTLFATVSAEKMKIPSWSEHIDLFKQDSHGISREEFDEKSNGLFGSR